MNFTSEEDVALARIFLLEMKDTRNVMNAPAIIYHDKAPPQEVVDKFPAAFPKEMGVFKSKTSNGSIEFRVGEKAIQKGLDGPLSQLIGFR